MVMPICGPEMYQLLSSLFPAGEPKAAGKGGTTTASDNVPKQKTAGPVAEPRTARSRLFPTRSGKEDAPATGIPAQRKSLHKAATWSSDTETLVASDDEMTRPDGARVVREQVRRCEAHHERSVAHKLRDCVKGMATLSSTDAPPAFQIPDDGRDVATEIVHAAHWELQRTDPANIDPVELARAVACVERWRSEGHAGSARDAAIEAWLKAFSLGETMSVQSLIDSYASGSTGYEHKGKGIATNIATGLASGVVSAAAKAGPEAAVAVAGLRSVGGAIAAGLDAASGSERFKRLPQEELAALLMIDAKERALQAPNMRDALRLARELHHAAGKKQSDEKTPPQERLIEHEKMIKARLNISAEEWVGKRRELPVRAVATGMTGTGAALSLALPPAAALMPAFIGASAAVHASYRLMRWDREDTRDRLRLRLFNHIKSYSWAPGGKLAPARIAHLVGEFEAGTITRDALAQEVKPLLVHTHIGKVMRFPAELRLERAEDLLRGKLAEAMEKELRHRKKSGRTSDADASVNLHRLLADLFNVQRARGLVIHAAQLSRNGFPERTEAALRSAAAYLRAVSDSEVQDLFTGDMATQVRAVTHARSLIKGEASRYRYTLGIGALPAIALAPVANPAGEPLHALAGNEATSTYKAGTAGGAVASSGLAVNLMFAKPASHEDADERENAFAIPCPNQPASAKDFADQTLDVLLCDGRMPAVIAYVPNTENHGAEASDNLSHISATEPYARAIRRRDGIAARVKIKWSRAAAGASSAWDSAREPFLRQAVGYYMRRSRASRRERQRAIEKLQFESVV